MELPATLGLLQGGAGMYDMATSAIRDVFNQGIRGLTAAAVIPQLANVQTAQIQRAGESVAGLQQAGEEQHRNAQTTQAAWQAQQPGYNGNSSYVDEANKANTRQQDAFDVRSRAFEDSLNRQVTTADSDYATILNQRDQAIAAFESDRTGVLDSLTDTRATDLRSVGAQTMTDYQTQLSALEEARASGQMSTAAYTAAKMRLDQQTANTRADHARTAMDMYSRRVADARIGLTNSRQQMLSAWGNTTLGAQANRQSVQDAASRGFAHLLDTDVALQGAKGDRLSAAMQQQSALDTAASRWVQANDDEWANWQRGTVLYRDSLASQIDSFTVQGLTTAASLMAGFQMQNTGPGMSQVVGNAVNAWSAGKAGQPDEPAGDWGMPGGLAGAGIGYLAGGVPGALIGGAGGYAAGSMARR